MKFSPETARGHRHEKCCEFFSEILLFVFPHETKLESDQKFSRQILRHFSRDALQLQMPDVMAFFILQTFVLETFWEEAQASEGDRVLGCRGRGSKRHLSPDPHVGVLEGSLWHTLGNSPASEVHLHLAETVGVHAQLCLRLRHRLQSSVPMSIL